MKALAHEDESVRQAVIASLIKRGNEKSLVETLQTGSTKNDVRIAIAQALLKSKNSKVQHAASLFLTVNGEGEDAVTAARNLGKKGGSGVEEALGKALKHKEASVRIAAAESLGQLGKTSALNLLAQADLDDVESGESARTAIRSIYGAQKLDFVLKATNSKDPVLKRSAVSSLGVLVKSGKAKRSRKRSFQPCGPE